MDEILTRWATDLTTYTREFKSSAETIAKWDQKIVDNQSKIDNLYIKTRTCEKQTMSVEMQLTAVENQQAELESWLSKYEADVDEMLAKENSNPAEVGGPDQEREKTYKLAEKLSERLDEMGTDLEAMVEEVNAANAGLSKTGKADEPVSSLQSTKSGILTDHRLLKSSRFLTRISISCKPLIKGHLHCKLRWPKHRRRRAGSVIWVDSTLMTLLELRTTSIDPTWVEDSLLKCDTMMKLLELA